MGVTSRVCIVYVTGREYHYGYLSVENQSRIPTDIHHGPVSDAVAILSGCICMCLEYERKLEHREETRPDTHHR